MQNRKAIKQAIKKVNQSIPGQDFVFKAIYSIDAPAVYIVLESRTHPGRELKISISIKNGKLDAIAYEDPGFYESDCDYTRIRSILNDVIPENMYCVWITGYFEDTPNTAYQNTKKVYPQAAFCIWVDPEAEIDYDSLIELCKDTGVLALSIEYIPHKLFDEWQGKYDTKQILEYHSLLIEEAAKKNKTIPGRDFCFGKPAYKRKETDPPEKGYAPSECY